jgi:UPF0755 protein
MKLKPYLKTIVGMIVILFFGAFLFCWQVYIPKEPGSPKTILFLVDKGQSDEEIARGLERQEIITNNYFFMLYVIISGKHSKLQAGRYNLSPSMSIAKIVEKFVLGDVQKEKITIIEGWDLKDVKKYFEEKGICSGEEFLKLVNEDFSAKFDFLKDKPKKLNLEGYIFPDTYEIFSGQEATDVLDKILTNFDKKLTKELRDEISKQNKTIFEVITMASLIEKEVKTIEDKKIISGIFWKRLKNGIPLQSCATINYITGKNDAGALLIDTQIDSPYNTYKYKGLPLGPISNPGMDSIIAAIYPKETEYWYYLSGIDGKTIFSKTLKEHNIAKARYLR